MSELGAQVTFPPNKRPTFRMGSTIYLFFLSVTPQDEWRMQSLPAGKPDGLNTRESVLTQQFPEIWMEDNSSPTPTPRLAKQAPLVTELSRVQLRQHPPWVYQTLLSH